MRLVDSTQLASELLDFASSEDMSLPEVFVKENHTQHVLANAEEVLDKFNLV